MLRRLPLITLLALLVGLAPSASRRDTVPPELYVEMAQRVPAGQPFLVFVSASEPVRYRVSYGELELERVSQDLELSLLAEPGPTPLALAAADAAGNETFYQASVEGVPAPEPRLVAPSEARPGDPITVEALWDAGAARVVAARASGAELGPLQRSPGRLLALGAIPLGSSAGERTLEVALEDEFGLASAATATLTVLESRHAIQELAVSASTLSVITPEGRERERAALEAAFAAQGAEPRWREPFLLPIEGRATSGFGIPRRYAPGGPVSHHEGSDIAAPEGTPVLAANDGRVLIADFFPIKGGLVVIDHGAGVSSLYFHQSRIAVQGGELVARGQPIGEVGATGLATGPHLHWEMRVAGIPTDPMAWVGKTLP